MRRKITYILSLLMIVCMLGACGSDNSKTTYGGYTEDELKEEAQTSLTNIQNYLQIVNSYDDYDAYKEDVENAEEKSGRTEGELVYSVLAQNGQTASMKNIDAELATIPTWLDLVDEYGDVADTTEGKDFTVTKSGGTLTTDMTLEFGKQDVTFEMVYDSVNMKVTGIGLTPVQTMGQKLAQAGQNTAISMSIVFCVLILISLIIYCFKFIALIGNKEKKAEPVKSEEKKETATVAAAPAENLTDDTELVAVISAAIAASEGTTTEGFVVRSINRR